MNTEYEIRILEIDHEKIVQKLESLGAKKTIDALQERYIYDVIPKDDHKWIRLRTNGVKTTLTIKDLKARTIDGMKEIEIEVKRTAKAFRRHIEASVSRRNQVCPFFYTLQSLIVTFAFDVYFFTA